MCASPVLTPCATMLQAFPKEGEHRGSWGAAGWGVRSTVGVNAGQAVLELCGCWLSDEQLSNTAERSYVIGFDEKTTQAPRVWCHCVHAWLAACTLQRTAVHCMLHAQHTRGACLPTACPLPPVAGQARGG